MTEDTSTKAPKALDDTSSDFPFATREEAVEAMKKDFADLAERRAKAFKNAVANDRARQAKEIARRRKADKAARKARKASRKRR